VERLTLLFQGAIPFGNIAEPLPEVKVSAWAFVSR
jgi:hypothetical protein